MKKLSITALKNKVWAECKRIIRIRYGNVCYTCHRSGLEAGNWHTGHLYPKAALGMYLKYDLRLLRPQCYHCNINLGGNGAIFYQNMLDAEGKEYMDGINRDRNVTVKATDHLISILASYKTIVR